MNTNMLNLQKHLFLHHQFYTGFTDFLLLLSFTWSDFFMLITHTRTLIFITVFNTGDAAHKLHTKYWTQHINTQVGMARTCTTMLVSYNWLSDLEVAISLTFLDTDTSISSRAVLCLVDWAFFWSLWFQLLKH